jgi:hypothetical protein
MWFIVLRQYHRTIVQAQPLQSPVTVNSNPEVADQSTTACSASTVGLTLADDVDGPSVASYDLTSITPSAGLAADASNAVLGTNLASDAIASDVWTNTYSYTIGCCL